MAVFFENLVDISLGATGAWTDIDLSAFCPAGTTLVAVLVQQTNGTEQAQAVGIRCNGSTDNRTPDMNQGQAMVYFGCDENRIIEGYIESTDVNFYLAGYWTTDAYSRENGRDLSLTSGPSGYVDITNNYSNAGTIAVYEVSGGRGNAFQIRSNGSTDARYLSTAGFTGALAGTDASNITEGAIASTGTDFFGIAYISLSYWTVNRAEESPAGAGSYETKTLADWTPPSGACAACLEVNWAAATLFGIRAYGSSDDYYYTGGNMLYYTTAMSSPDQKIDQKVGSVVCDMFKVAYFAPASWAAAVDETYVVADGVVAAPLLNIAVSETFSVTDDLDPVEVQANVAEAIALSESGSFRKSLLTVTIDMTGGGCADAITVKIPVG